MEPPQDVFVSRVRVNSCLGGASYHKHNFDVRCAIIKPTVMKRAFSLNNTAFMGLQGGCAVCHAIFELLTSSPLGVTIATNRNQVT